MKRMKQMLSLLLALVMVLGMLPVTALAAENQVRVIVENTTYEDTDFYGEGLVDIWVDMSEKTTMMDYILAALDENGISYPEDAAENGYLSEIGGLAEKSQGGGPDDASGWMGSWNDWFVNTGFSGTTGIRAGDEIRVMYSLDGGEDLGAKGEIDDNADDEIYYAQIANRTAHLSDLQVFVGELEQSLSFSRDTAAYEITVPADTESVQVLPTAANKQYQVNIQAGDTEYRRVDQVPLNDEADTVITVTSGCIPDARPDGREKTYTLTVKKQTVEPADPADVFVTVADNAGKLVLVQEKITVTDRNTDGKLNIDEALYAAHEAKYSGGAAAGYDSEVHATYGLSITKLWGNTSGNYGYYVNNVSAWSLDDPVKANDFVNAYINQTSDWSDVYCFFDKTTAEAQQEDMLELTLSKWQWNSDYTAQNQVPVVGATITLDGTATESVTDENGKASVKLTTAGKVTISAASSTQTLVPPVCVVTVEEKQPALTRLVYYDSGVKVIDLTAENPATELSKTSTHIGLSAYFDADLYTASAQFAGGEATVLTAAASDYSGTSVAIPGQGERTLTITVSSIATGETVETHIITVTNPEPVYDEDNTLQNIVVEYHDGAYKTVTVYQADAAGKATEITTISNDHKYYAATLPAGTTGYYLAVSTNATSAQKQNAFEGGAWEAVTNYPVRAIPESGTSVVKIRIADDKTYAEKAWNGSDSDYNIFNLWVTVAAPETVAVESVALNKTELTLAEGGEETLTATVLPGNATNKAVTWSVEGDAVTVADGEVTAVKAGEATVTATTVDGAKTASCTVTVTAKPEVTAAGLTNLEFSSSTGTSATTGFNAKKFAMEPAVFDPAVTAYTVYAPDNDNFLAIKATAAEGYTGTITASSGTTTKELTSATAAYLGSSNAVIKDSLTGNTVTITLEDGTVYTITIVRIASFKSLTIQNQGTALTLSPTFNRSKYSYTAFTTPGILDITVTANEGVGMEVDSVSGATGKVPQWDENRQTILTVTATNDADARASRDYTFNLTQAPNSIAVTKAPNKTAYAQGDTFDPAGMEVTAYFNDATVILSSTDYTISPSGALTEETQVTITYRSVTTTQPINLPRLPGQGTEADPFTISTVEDAKMFRDLVNGGARFAGQVVSLAADLSISADWIPVGTTKDGTDGNASWGIGVFTVQDEKTAFCGTFKGNNHTISLASGSRPFFGSVGTGAYIQDLNIYGPQIAGNGLIEYYCRNQGYTLDNITLKSGTQTLKSGFLTGYGNKAVTIKNSTVESGVVIGYNRDQSKIGSFAGDFVGTIDNCVSYATVYGVDHVGGIVGCKGQSMSAFAVTNCTFGGSVQASGKYAGGISGSGYGGSVWGISNNPKEPTITDCTVTGSVSGTEAVGGILGAEHGAVQAWANGAGSISNNTFTGTVSGTSKVGGIIGYLRSLNKNLTISNNTYPAGCGAELGIAAVDYVDTSYENPTPVEGTTYVNSKDAKPSIAGMTQKGHNRTDDPLGVDAESLCQKIGGKDEAVAAVEALISNIGSVTLTSKDAIDTALAAMNALTAEQQAQVTNASILADAENAYGNLALADKILQPATGGDAISSFTVSKGDSDYILRYDSAADSFTALNAAIPNSTAVTAMNFTIAKDTVLNFTPSFVGNGTDSFKIVLTKIANPYDPMPLALDPDLEEAAPGTEMTLVNRPTAADVTSVKIPAGTYTLTMTYTQDGTVNAGEGASVTGLTLTKVPDAALIAEAEAAIDVIGDVTVSSGTAIKTARALYNSLTDEEKALVTNYETLTAAETAYAEIQDNFTGYRVAVSEEKTVEVDGNAQVKLTISHNTETQYNAYRFVVTYDPDVVTYISIDGTEDEATVTDEDGTLTIIGYGDAKTFEKLPTLTFRGKANGDSQIQLTEAGIDNSAHAIEHNTAAALIGNAETFIHVGGYIVELSGDLIGEGIAAPNGDYTFRITDPNYTYTIKAYMMTPDGEVAVDVIDNGDGTYTIRNVTGKLRIISSRTAKTFGVTVEGTAKDDVTLSDGAPTYLEDYEFSVTRQEGYTYDALTVTIGGANYQAAQFETDKYRISGTDVTGNIVISLNKTKNEEGSGDTPSTTTTITFVGEGSADVAGGTAQTAANGTDFTFSINEEAGYIYNAKIGEEGLQPNEEGVYTIPGAQITGTAITVTVDKESEVERTVEVNEYVKLDGKSIFLVTANGDVHEGNVLTYHAQEMYWSETYHAYAYLIVSDKSLTEVTTEAEAAIAEAKATKLTISYTGDINNTNQIDVNDAQLVYDMYNALYGDFSQVSIEKFLRADMNGSKSLTVEDSAAIVALVD